MKKKTILTLIVLLLVLCLCFMLVACGEKDKDNGNAPIEPSTPTQDDPIEPSTPTQDDPIEPSTPTQDDPSNPGQNDPQIDNNIDVVYFVPINMPSDVNILDHNLSVSELNDVIFALAKNNYQYDNLVVAQNQIIYLYIGLKNSNRFTIDSIEINEQTFDSSKFDELSTNTQIILKYNVGEGIGSSKIAVSKISYNFDDSTIKTISWEKSPSFNINYSEFEFSNISIAPDTAFSKNQSVTLSWDYQMNPSVEIVSLMLYENEQPILNLEPSAKSIRGLEMKHTYTLNVIYKNSDGIFKTESLIETTPYFYIPQLPLSLNIYSDKITFNSFADIENACGINISEVTLYKFIDETGYIFDTAIDLSTTQVDNLIIGTKYLLTIKYDWMGFNLINDYPFEIIDTGIYIQPAAYFDALWAASATLGSQTFKAADAAALSADLDIMLALGGDVFDLGVAIGAVIDPAGACTAVKVQIYDKEAGENWFTIFYFAEDQDNLYVEAYDQKLCIPVAISEILPNVGEAVADLLNTVIDVGKGTKIVDLINAIKTAGGEDWTIDNLVDVILGLLGMSLDDVIDLVNGLGIVTLDEGAKSLLPVLEQLGGILFNAPKKDKKSGKWTGGCTREEITGGYCYTGNVGGSLGLVELLSGLVKEYVGDLIDEDSSLQLIFNTVEDESATFKADGIKDINGFKIRVESYECEIAGGKDVTVEIGINEVKIENLGAVKKGDAADFFGFKKADFSSDFNITLALDLAISDKALVINHEGMQIDFAGDYQLVLNGIIDLKNGINTKADLALMVGDKAVVSAYFGPQAGTPFSELVITVDNTVTIDGIPIVETLVKLFAPYGLEALAKSTDAMFQKAAVDLSNAAFGTEFTAAADVLNAVAAWKEKTANAFATYDTAFTGVAIKNIKLVDMLVDLINGLVAGGEGSAVSSAEPALNILGLIATVFDAISFEKGIEVKVDSIIATIQAIFGGLKEADALAMLKITEEYLNPAWWSVFFAGSKWVKGSDVASLTNLLKSAAEISISIGEVAKINAKLTTPDGASVKETISLSVEADSDYTYKLLLSEGCAIITLGE